MLGDLSLFLVFLQFCYIYIYIYIFHGTKYKCQVPSTSTSTSLIVWLFHCFIVWLIDCVDTLGLGPLGAPGPRCRIRVEHVTTYCQASYLLSGMHPNVAAYFAPNNRIQTTYCQAKLPTVRQAFSLYETCTQQPHTLHPNVSADLHPTTAYMHPTDP